MTSKLSIDSPPRRIRRAPSDMRAQALAAARRLIIEGNESVLTMRAVADAAGVTYPNLSHHFGSAAGLHAAIAEDLLRELFAGLETVGLEMDNHAKNYAVLVDRVFELFDRNGLGRVIGWLVRSGDAAALEPVNLLMSKFLAGRARGDSPAETRRIARIASIVALAAYAESSIGPLLGGVLGAPASARRQFFAEALTALEKF